MKVILEDKTVKHRGIIVSSETDEEKVVLTNIWVQKGAPAMFSRDGTSVSITIAPTPDEGEV
ncbi:MAG: hypothetical protein Q8P59_12910 [Dehalococcoidia bacterium]|nr:hypothetical protein [Dehalococcoidia bacterium]